MSEYNNVISKDLSLAKDNIECPEREMRELLAFLTNSHKFQTIETLNYSIRSTVNVNWVFPFRLLQVIEFC